MISIPLLLAATPGLAGSQGTTISGTKTSSATIMQTETYKWSHDKQCPPMSSYDLPYGSSITLPFTIVVNRSGPVSSSTTSPITGQVCLTNEGTTVATNGLFGVDQLEYLNGGAWSPLSTHLLLPIASELNPGQRQCYDYEFSGIPLSPETVYQNRATVSIDNFLDFEGTTHSIDITSPIDITLKTDIIDENARLLDEFVCPVGFSCTASGPDVILSGSDTITYNVTITNDAAHCETTFQYLNTAELTTNDTNTQYDDSCTVSLITEACGCSGTIGYWRNHAELIQPILPLYLGSMGGGKTLAVSTTQIALDVIEQNVYGSPSNGITKLYAQLLGVKIAIARGASPSPIGNLIVEADAFLASHDFNDWASLSAEDQAKIIAWQSAFANYNLGVTGPGHC